MKAIVKKRMSDYLMGKDFNKTTVQNLKSTYEKFIREVQNNIESTADFSKRYHYLMNTRFYFEEIRKGYRQKTNLQLEFFPYIQDISKKKNY